MSYPVITSTLAFLVASAALVMILSPLVTEAPWEEGSSSASAAPILNMQPNSSSTNSSRQSSAMSALEHCISAYRSHTHTYSPTDVSHSHSLEPSMFGGGYTISPHQKWGFGGLGQATSGPKAIGYMC